MRRQIKFQVVFSIVVALVALLATWLILDDSSPFERYFARHVGVRNMCALTVFLPFVVSAVLSGNPHSPPMAPFVAGLSLQWLVIGYLLSIPVARLRARGS